MSWKKILLIAPIHHYRDYIYQCLDNNNIDFPNSQWQFYWIKTIRKLWYSIDVYKYSDIPFLSSYNSAIILDFFISKFNLIYKIIDRFFYLFPYLSMNNYFRNYLLLKKVKNNNYNLIIFSGWTNKIFEITLLKIKKRWVKLVFSYWMSPLIYANKFEKTFAKNWDYIITNDPIHAKEWYILQQDNSFSLPVSSIDSDFKDNNIDFNKREYEITFIWRISPLNVYKKRLDTLVKLKEVFWDKLNIWTSDKKTINDYWLESNYRWEAYWRKMFKILKKSKIVINDHGNTMPWWWNMRTFEICWAWALQIVDFINEEWFVNWEEIVIFNNMNDLIEKIKYYLINDKERIKITINWFNKVYKKHTYDKHFKKLFEKIWI